MPDSLERKREREAARRKKFTPEQKAAAAAYVKLYMQHRRLTDADYADRIRKQTRRLYTKHRDKRVAAMREKNKNTRKRCIDAYGGVCACCGEENFRFLTLDHIVARPDGADAVRVGGSRVGQSLYSWCIRMNFPPGLRVLCYNCNCGRSANNGVCPHEEEFGHMLRKAG